MLNDKYEWKNVVFYAEESELQEVKHHIEDSGIITNSIISDCDDGVPSVIITGIDTDGAPIVNYVINVEIEVRFP